MPGPSSYFWCYYTLTSDVTQSIGSAIWRTYKRNTHTARRSTLYIYNDTRTITMSCIMYDRQRSVFIPQRKLLYLYHNYTVCAAGLRLDGGFVVARSTASPRPEEGDSPQIIYELKAMSMCVLIVVSICKGYSGTWGWCCHGNGREMREGYWFVWYECGASAVWACNASAPLLWWHQPKTWIYGGCMCGK